MLENRTVASYTINVCCYLEFKHILNTSPSLFNRIDNIILSLGVEGYLLQCSLGVIVDLLYLIKLFHSIIW